MGTYVGHDLKPDLPDVDALRERAIVISIYFSGFYPQREVLNRREVSPLLLGLSNVQCAGGVLRHEALEQIFLTSEIQTGRLPRNAVDGQSASAGVVNALFGAISKRLAPR